GGRVPAAWPELLGLVPQHLQLARRLAGCSGQPDRERSQAVDGEEVTPLAVLDHTGRPLGEGRPGQAAGPEIVGLEDVAVGGDHAHGPGLVSAAMPVRWDDIARAEPAFAERVRALFDARKHKTMATLRKDGSPRISGMEVEFRDGDALLGMM